jgi:O-antigen ligase
MKRFSISRLRPMSWPQRRLLLLLLLCGVLLVALAATIWVDNALNRGITYTPDPEPIPWADEPQVGVNVYNLHLEPDPAAVTRTLQLARDMGAHYIRMQVPWEDIEIHGRGDFQDRRNIESVGVVSAWDKYDRIVDMAHALDLELVMRIDRPPDWARPITLAAPFFQEGLEKDPTSTGPPDNFDDYGNFVHTLVSRYRGKVRFFQIWNEPNLKNEWNWHVPSPEGFVELLRVGSTAAREANPDAVILFPSLSPVDGLDERAPMTELEYLDEVYQLGGDAYFDIMSVQLYGLGQPPDEHRYVRVPIPFQGEWTWRRPLDTRTDVSRVVLLREVMERHGAHDTPVWVGEFGWNSAPESIPEWRRTTWGEPVSEAQKAAYILGMIERARNEWPWMGVMHVWTLRHGGYQEPDPEDPTPYFALVQRDWTLLPAYTALQTYLAQPATASLGAHTWQHPAVEATDTEWRLRFSGQQVTLPGEFDGEVRAVLDGTPTTLERTTIDGQEAWRTGKLADGVHTLEIHAPGAEPPSRFVVSREPPLPLWLWSVLPLALVLGLMAGSAAAMPGLFNGTRALLSHTPPARLGWRAWLATPGGERALLLTMLAGLLVFYGFSNDLPTRLVGVAIFGVLACLRPELALLYVPLTVPLFFIPKGIWDTRFGLPERGVLLPLHEMILLVVAGATMLRWLLERFTTGAALPRLRALLGSRQQWWALAPVILFVLAGTLAVVIVPPEARRAALREWRWLIVEPLLFYALLHYHGARAQAHEEQGLQAKNYPLAMQAGVSSYRLLVLRFFLVGGAFVGLLGILQFLGLNLVPFVGPKAGFSDDQIFVEGVRRVSSVYGHPNNLGLYMGRIWPLAAALALVAIVSGQRWRQRDVLFFGGCCLLAGGGLLVSFSKGALLGAVVASGVLCWLLLRHHMPAIRRAMQQYSRRPGWLRMPVRIAGLLVGLVIAGSVLAIGAIVAGDAVMLERLNPLGASSSARLKLWASSLAMLRDHPLFGVGLDQFLVTYEYYIHPSLVGTNEEYASHPHNLVLNLWLRLGVPGVMAFGWLMVRFARRVLHSARMSLVFCGLAAAMSAALAHGLVDNFYFVPDLAFSFWLLLWVANADV